MIHLGRLTAGDLESGYRSATASELTYSHVGSSLRRDPRPGGRLRRATERVGSGQPAFLAGCDRLRRWAPHAAFGAQVHPPAAPISVGTTVLVILSWGPFDVVAANRIVEVVDEPQAFGFAYGTLPGHPACGEEGFLVRMDDTGAVSASVTIDAVAGTWLTRLGAPVARRVQDRAVRRYLAGVAGR